MNIPGKEEAKNSAHPFSSRQFFLKIIYNLLFI